MTTSLLKVIPEAGSVQISDLVSGPSYPESLGAIAKTQRFRIEHAATGALRPRAARNVRNDERGEN